jgi:hypothetical protein
MLGLSTRIVPLISESNKGKTLLLKFKQFIRLLTLQPTIIMKKSILLIAAVSLFLASCGSNCMGKGVNFADTDDAKENYIMTAEDASCVEVY